MCYFKPLKSKPLRSYWVVLCNKYSLFVWQNKGFSPYFAHNFSINIAQMACKSGCFALQKSRFGSVRAMLSQSKTIYFINSFLFYRFLFFYFTLSGCVKFITSFTGFQNNKYELSKMQILRF